MDKSPHLLLKGPMFAGNSMAGTFLVGSNGLLPLAMGQGHPKWEGGRTGDTIYIYSDPKKKIEMYKFLVS